jgi:hypothetical protein
VKLTGRIPVEPLDDERLTRIERRIVAGAAELAAAPRARPRPSTALAFAAAAALAIGAGAIGWTLRGGRPAPAELAAAPVEVRADDQRTTLDLGDARIQSDPSTRFTVTRPAGGVLIAMARGKVALEVGKRGERPPLVVRAGDTEVVVVGTRFSVDYGDGSGEVDVRVTEGAVRVVRHQQETRIAAGQAWTSSRGLVALDEPARVTGGPGGDPAGAARGDARIDPSSRDVAIDMSEAPEVLRDRAAAAPGSRGATSGGSAAGPRGAAGSRASTDPAGRARPFRDPRDPMSDLKAAIRAQPVLPALDVAEPDPLKAMAEYRAVMTREKGPTEAHAFYSMALVQALKLGRTDDALATLAAFKRRAQTSEYFVPALWLEVRVRCLRSIDAGCREAAEGYLRSAPDGPAHHVAEKIALTR